MKTIPIQWTNDMDAVVLKMHGKGHTLEETSDVLGVSRKSVSRRRQVLGIGARSGKFDWTSELDERLQRMASDRVSVTAQAARLGVSRALLQHRRSFLGIKATLGSWTEADSERAAELHALGMSMVEIGKVMGFHASSIAEHLLFDGVIERRKKQVAVEEPIAEPKVEKSHVEFRGLVIAKAMSPHVHGVSLSAGCAWSAGA